MKANVYIDGFNLYYGALKDRPNCKWLDLDALCRRLLPQDQINRIRYFTALVGARHDPQTPVRQQAYFRALGTIPCLSMHYGRYVTRPTRMRLANPPQFGAKTAEVLKTEEKGSDVNLASFLLLDAAQKDCEVAVVISNDADLKAPIEIAQNDFGVTVGVINPHPPHKRSRDLRPTFFKQLRENALHQSQFPTTLQDAQGAITKPATWH
jgi:hypothetical protein